MRATFRPCSPSGIAQPRITSSTSSGGGAAGARASASRMTTDAMSSGRITLSVPFGALPTAVRTAETMTASCIAHPSQSASRSSTASPTSDGLPIEHVIGALDHDQLFRLVQLGVEPPDVARRDDARRARRGSGTWPCRWPSPAEVEAVHRQRRARAATATRVVVQRRRSRRPSCRTRSRPPTTAAPDSARP